MDIGGVDLVLPYSSSTEGMAEKVESCVEYFKKVWKKPKTVVELDESERYKIIVITKSPQTGDFVEIIFRKNDVTFVFETVKELENHVLNLVSIVYS